MCWRDEDRVHGSLGRGAPVVTGGGIVLGIAELDKMLAGIIKTAQMPGAGRGEARITE